MNIPQPLLFLLALIGLTATHNVLSAQTDASKPFVMQRTTTKVIPAQRFHKSYTIQILARQGVLPPDYFDGLSTILQGQCEDGWTRYFIGEYETSDEATKMLTLVKGIHSKYADAFVQDTRNINLRKTTPPIIIAPAILFRPLATGNDTTGRQTEKHEQYAVQITATCYPIFLSEIVEFKKTEEFYIPQDHSYRYTTGRMDLAEAKIELKRALESGYLDAAIVNPDAYTPYKVE